MIEQLIDQIGELVSVVANKPELFTNVGKIYRNAFTGFVDAGFSEEQAFELCKGLASALGQKK